MVEGAGDVGSAVAYSLHTSGVAVVLVEGRFPLTTRRRMSFSDAVFDGACKLVGVTARRSDDLAALDAALDAGEIPLLIEPRPATLPLAAIVDARLSKKSIPDDRRDQAPVVIGLGPGFAAGINCHLAIETQHGDRTGDLIEQGATLAYDGIPGEVAGTRRERQVHASGDGVFHTKLSIGDEVRAGEEVGTVSGAPQVAAIGGVLKGLLRAGLTVSRGVRVAEVVPAGADVAIVGIGVRPRLIAAGVLRAIVLRRQRHGHQPRSEVVEEGP